MADGFIVRKGGAVTEQALAPTITEVSTTETSITFTITNNDASTAVIAWESGDITPDANILELAAAATSSNIEVTGLTEGTTYTISATASVTGKILSTVTSLGIETDDPEYALDFDGTDDFVSFDVYDLNNHDFKHIIQIKFDSFPSLSRPFGNTGSGNNLYFLDITPTAFFWGSRGSVDQVHGINGTHSMTTGVWYEFELFSDEDNGNNYTFKIDGVAQTITQQRNEARDTVTIATLRLGGTSGAFLNGQIRYFATYEDGVLIQEFLFDEETGTTLNDNVGTDDGTITGATWVTQ
jgi:hypothetical protein